ELKALVLLSWVIAPYPARALAEHAAAAGAAASEAAFGFRQHLIQQEILPGAHRSRVDVLVAAEPSEAIGKGNNARRHARPTAQPVEALGGILAEANPVRMG